jgi:hypothetical protein
MAAIGSMAASRGTHPMLTEAGVVTLLGRTLHRETVRLSIVRIR